jgi:hypothetical protein
MAPVAEIEVCAGAVLSGSGGTEPETSRSVPEQYARAETGDGVEYRESPKTSRLSAEALVPL